MNQNKPQKLYLHSLFFNVTLFYRLDGLQRLSFVLNIQGNLHWHIRNYSKLFCRLPLDCLEIALICLWEHFVLFIPIMNSFSFWIFYPSVLTATNRWLMPSKAPVTSCACLHYQWDVQTLMGTLVLCQSSLRIDTLNLSLKVSNTAFMIHSLLRNIWLHSFFMSAFN